jgi:prepilin-type N-terminal cleavage/methylation domain-containing protein
MVVLKKPKQRAFTIIELVITLAITAILIMMMTPIIRSSIAEHRALNMVAVIKTELEWARNQALSTNSKYQFKPDGKGSICLWGVYLSGGKNALPQHQRLKEDASDNYRGVYCKFNFGKLPLFNGLGMSENGALDVVEITADATTRKWTIKLESLGDVKVTVQ